MKKRALFFTCCLSVLLSGCATPTTNVGTLDTAAVRAEELEQKRFLFAQYRKDQERIFKIVEPIFRAATDLCPSKVAPTWGMFAISNLGSWGKEDRAAVKAEYGLAEEITFTYVESNGPLSRAGVQRGDQIVALNGKQYKASARGLRDAMKDLAALGDEMSELKILRAGVESTVQIVPEHMPKLAVVYDPIDGEVNAFADGESLNVKRGLLRAMPSDEALAMVLAHEIAHNCQRHIESKQTNMAIGTVLDVLAAAGGVSTGGYFGQTGASAYSQDFEREADYVGLYYLARVGRPLEEAMAMYRVLSAETGGAGIKSSYNASHPGTAERFVRMQATIKEIEAKRAAGQPLVPNPAK